MRGLVATSLAAILLVSLGGCGSKYASDKEMQALCAKDGGMKVYETVVLPASEFSRYGEPLDRYRLGNPNPEDRLGPDYRWIEQTEFLKRGDTLKGEVQLIRGIQKISRRSDGKLLGESIEYGRSGGDLYVSLLLGLHPSSSSCPTGQGSLVQTIFIQGR